MITRNVTCARRSERGVIVLLGNSIEWWAPRPTELVVADIKSGKYEYWAVGASGIKARIHVCDGELRADFDESDGNGLDELPFF